MSDGQRTSASSRPDDWKLSSRPPSFSASLPGSAPLCGYTRDSSSLCSEPSGQPAADTDSKATEQTQNETLKGNAEQTLLKFFIKATPAHCRKLCIHVCAWLLAKSLQSCPTFCDPMGRSLPGSSVHGILQTRMLEWIAIPFSRGSSQPRDQTWISCIAGGFFMV